MNRILRNRKALKWVIIAEAIVCYMVFLAVVSYLRGPARYQVISDTPVIEVQDFVSLSGEKVGDGPLFIKNETAGNAVGYSGDLELKANDRVYVHFVLDCPLQYSGGILYVDLYKYQIYDFAEQQVELLLKEGRNEVEISLDAGRNPPLEASLRIFTASAAEYTVQDLKVYKEEPIARVSGGLKIALAVAFAFLAGTAVIYFRKRPDTRRGEQR